MNKYEAETMTQDDTLKTLDQVIHTLRFAAKSTDIKAGDEQSFDAPANITISDLTGLHHVLNNCIELCERAYELHCGEN